LAEGGVASFVRHLNVSMLSYMNRLISSLIELEHFQRISDIDAMRVSLYS